MGTSATADFPGLTVEIDFVTGANTAAGTWTDVTTDVRAFSIRRGRQLELQRFEAGVATVTLDNRLRTYDPEYSAGAHFGNLLPMRQMRIRAVWSATTYDIGRFYITGWPQSYPGYDSDSVVTLEAVDGFAVLALAPVDTPWAVEVKSDSPYAWWRLGEDRGEIMGDASGNGRHGSFATSIVQGQGSLVPYDTNGSLVFDGLDDGGSISYSQAHVSSPFTVECWVQTPSEFASEHLTIVRQDSGIGGLTATSCDHWHLRLNDTNFFTAEYFGVAAANPEWSDVPALTKTVYHLAFVYSASPGILYVNGVAQTLVSGGGQVAEGVFGAVLVGGRTKNLTKSWKGSIDDVALYTSALSAATVLDHYNAGANPWNGDASGTRVGRILDAIAWPASLRDIDTGTSLLGPASWDQDASALQILQDIAQTETAYLYMTGAGALRFVGRNNRKTEAAYSVSNATFGDSGAELDYADIVTSYDDTLIRNVAKVSRRGGIQQSYEDATSKAAYGPRTISEDGLLMASDNEAYDRAIWRVLTYKDPAWRVDSLVLKGRKAPTTLWPQLLGRELGERITVVRRPQGVGSSISKEVHIEGVEHVVNWSTKTWDTTWHLSPVDPNEATWAIVGSGSARTQVGTAVVSY